MRHIRTSTLSPTRAPLEVLDIENAAAVAQDIAWKYVVPVIFAFGLVGNILTLVVLMRGSLGKSSAVVYLFMLSLIDTGALISNIFTSYLQAAWNIELQIDSKFACQILNGVFPFFSNAGFWVLVAFTVDRYIAVCFPFKKTTLCRPRRAIAVCAVLLTLSAAKSARVFWTYRLHRLWSWAALGYIHICDISPRYAHFERHVRPYLSTAFVFAIPFLIMISCNVMIIRQLRQGNRLLQRTNADRKLTQTTAMCLSISFAFFVLASPIFIATIIKPYMHSHEIDMAEMRFRFLDIIAAMLLYTHHSVNFYLYCLTGRQFRADLRAAVCARCVKAGVGAGAGRRGQGPAMPGKPQQRAGGRAGNGAKVSAIEDNVASSSAGPQTAVTAVSEGTSTAIG